MTYYLSHVTNIICHESFSICHIRCAIFSILNLEWAIFHLSYDMSHYQYAILVESISICHVTLAIFHVMFPLFPTGKNFAKREKSVCRTSEETLHFSLNKRLRTRDWSEEKNCLVSWLYCIKLFMCSSSEIPRIFHWFFQI